MHFGREARNASIVRARGFQPNSERMEIMKSHGGQYKHVPVATQAEFDEAADYHIEQKQQRQAANIGELHDAIMELNEQGKGKIGDHLNHLVSVRLEQTEFEGL